MSLKQSTLETKHFLERFRSALGAGAPYVVESLDSTTYESRRVEVCGNDIYNFDYIGQTERI